MSNWQYAVLLGGVCLNSVSIILLGSAVWKLAAAVRIHNEEKKNDHDIDN